MSPNQNPDTLEKRIEKIETQLEVISSLIVKLGNQDKSKDDDKFDIFENIEKVTKTITSITASLAGLSFVFYALGFVIVNSHLISFGARKFDLLNPAYFSAGIVFIVVNSAAMAFPLWFTITLYMRSKLIKKENKQSANNSSKGIDLFTITSIVLTAAIFSLIWANLGSTTDQSAYANAGWKQMGWQIGYVAFLSILSASVTTIIQNIIETQETGFSNVLSNSELLKKFSMWTSSAIVIIIFLSSTLVVMWGRYMYPQISPAFGGGQLINVQLVAKDSNSQVSLESLELKFTKGVSESVKLVDDDENAILIVLSNGNAVRIPKELLSNIIYLKSQSSLPTATSLPTQTAIPVTSTPP